VIGLVVIGLVVIGGFVGCLVQQITNEFGCSPNAALARNGVKITFQFQACYFGVSQLSFEANSGDLTKKIGWMAAKEWHQIGKLF